MNNLKRIFVILIFSLITSNVIAQCAAGEVEIIINTSGGLYAGEKWVNITTGPNGTGTVLWAQGNWTIGNSSGLLTNQSVCVLDGVTYYFNCYDQYDDSWDGTTYTIAASGTVIADNGGATPDDGLDTDASTGWESIAAELESSEAFTATAPTPFPTDVCEDDAVISMTSPSAYSATSGKAGIAIILVTDAWASEISFDLYDLDGNMIYDETSFPGAPANLADKTVYTIYDNECFDVTTTAGIPDYIDIFDSGNDGIYDDVTGLVGAGFYIYYYAADAIEVFNYDNNGNGVEYVSPGTGAFPSFYTASTNQRTNTLLHDDGNMIGNFPGPSLYEYVSMGTWSGTGVANVSTSSKTYFGSFPGLARTITVPSGGGTFDPSVPSIGANSSQTYTYNSVYGSAGPASCNVETVTTTEVDVHARPTITPVANQPCNGATYSVTVDVDLDSYNVSVDQDGGTPFSVTGTGGTLSTSTLTGTGVVQVVISNIPSGSGWSIDVSDVSGISCGLTGTSGTCATVLPIELVSFWGEAKQNYNDLDWITSTEINNDYFVLEKSLDGIDFEEVEGYIPGAGNSTEQLSYDKIDENPFSQTYYRLKQVDYDGKYAYSNTIVLENNSNNLKDIAVYPNPIENDLVLNFESTQKGVANLYLTNTLGQVVFQKEVKTEVGLNNQNLSLEYLPQGIYFLALQLNDFVISEKVTKQ